MGPLRKRENGLRALCDGGVMGIRVSLIVVGLVCMLAAGCTKKQPHPEMDPTVVKFENFRQSYDGTEGDENAQVVSKEESEKNKASSKEIAHIAAPDSGVTSVVLARAHSTLGTPYVYGGTKPGGFDCSGLVQWAYKGAGISLPRTAREQSRSGFAIQDKSKLRAGDIVAFRRPEGYHTGIYIGDGKFIHAPRTNKTVRISSMDTSYFVRNFIGARRVDTSKRNMELARATEQADRKHMASMKSKTKNASAASGKAQTSKKTVTSQTPGRKTPAVQKNTKNAKKSNATAAKSTKKTNTAAAGSGKKPAATKAQSGQKQTAGKAASVKQTASRDKASNTGKKAASQKKPASATDKAASRTASSGNKKVAQTSKNTRSTDASSPRRTVEQATGGRGAASNEARERQNKG